VCLSGMSDFVQSGCLYRCSDKRVAGDSCQAVFSGIAISGPLMVQADEMVDFAGGSSYHLYIQEDLLWKEPFLQFWLAKEKRLL
jgi:hypothetical protein